MALIAAPVAPQAAHQAQTPTGLQIVVIDGEEAANIVDEKIAAEPVIEVRDRENRKVAGAVVRFQVRRGARNRLSAAFGRGKDELRTLTDAAGQARAPGLTPLEAGRFDIEVQVSHQGQSATTTIRHTNFSTSAQARSAGREPGQSSGQTAAQTAGPVAGSTGPIAAVAAGGGGLGKLAVIGLAVGGAAGAGAAVVLSQRNSDAVEGRVTAVTASARTGIQAATAFSFSAQVTGFEGSASYQWEFGDGATSTEPTPTHVYALAGIYTVVATVSDAQHSGRSETSVVVHTLTGTWVGSSPTLAGVYSLQLTHPGSAIGGSSSLPSTSTTGESGGYFSGCPLSGTAESGPPVIVLLQPPCSNGAAVLQPGEWRLELSADGQTLAGHINGHRQVTLRKQ